MAGDLYYPNPSAIHLDRLMSAGGYIENKIFHSDRPWTKYEQVLEDRLKNPYGANDRRNLPAHCYLVMSRNTYKPPASGTSDALLYEAVVGLLERPTSVVKDSPALSGWEKLTSGAAKAKMLADAFDQMADISIEFYIVNQVGVLDVNSYAAFQRLPE